MAVKKKLVKKTPTSKKAASKKVAKKNPVKKKPVKKTPVKKKPAKKVVVKKKPAKKITVKKKIVKKLKVKPAVKVKKPKTIAKKVATPKAKSTVTQKPVKATGKSSKRGSSGQTRYGDHELVEFKKLITEKLEGSRKELKYLHEQINRTAELGGDNSDNKFSGLEDGTGTSEKEYLSQMASRQIQYIDHLEKALIRIANKTYGICRVTGKLISKERLRAVPHATLSIEAKKAQSS